VTLGDHARTEKISDLPGRLSTGGAPAGYDPSAGDIAYHAPWGNLAIFYRDVGYSTGLTKLGAIESDGAVLNRPGSLRATIEPVEDQRDEIAMTWSSDEPRKIAETDDLHVSPFREDGVLYGTPTWIWSVAVDGALHVRARHGQDSRWHQVAPRQRAGRITAAGMAREATFGAADGPVNDLVDDAYWAKYEGSPYLEPMIGAARVPQPRKSFRAEPMADHRAPSVSPLGEARLPPRTPHR
jgi:hypothetical protein